jgi:hypothetical protein
VTFFIVQMAHADTTQPMLTRLRHVKPCFDFASSKQTQVRVQKGDARWFVKHNTMPENMKTYWDTRHRPAA